MKPLSNFYQRMITALCLLVLLYLFFCLLPPLSVTIVLSAILFFVLVFEWPPLCTSRFVWLLTPLYPMFPFFILMMLNHAAHLRLLVGIITVALFDTASYVVGKIVGRHPIAPTISPGKTWQGALGGWFLTCLIMRLFGYVWWYSTLLCGAALCGDLFESWLKRRAGIKDTAAILPGHGGFLDRLDGLLFAGVVIWVLQGASISG